MSAELRSVSNPNDNRAAGCYGVAIEQDADTDHDVIVIDSAATAGQTKFTAMIRSRNGRYTGSLLG
jgi:hypothetical protein